MFVKAREKRTLAENFLEAIKVEKELASISSHQGNKETKPSSSEKRIKKNKGILKLDTKKKENEPTDMERMQRVIKKLTNDIINLKKNKGEGKKPFKPFRKTRTNPVPQIPPTSEINIEDYAMDNYCCTHHANHSKRTLQSLSILSLHCLPHRSLQKGRKGMIRRRMKKTKRRRKKTRNKKNLHPT